MDYFHYFNFNLTIVDIFTLFISYYATIMLVFTVRCCFNEIHATVFASRVRVVVGLLRVVSLVRWSFIAGFIGCCRGLRFVCFFCLFLILVSIFIIASI